jgi:hypothetical protein
MLSDCLGGFGRGTKMGRPATSVGWRAGLVDALVEAFIEQFIDLSGSPALHLARGSTGAPRRVAATRRR